MDICDSNTNPNFNASFVEFALPQTNNPEDNACLMYEIIDPNGSCQKSNFNPNQTMTCSRHVFAPDVPYEYSLIEQLDLPSCPHLGNWPLKVKHFS